MFWCKGNDREVELAYLSQINTTLQQVHRRIYEMALNFQNLVDAVDGLASRVTSVEAKIAADKLDPAIEVANQQVIDGITSKVADANNKFDGLVTVPAEPQAAA